MAKSSSDAAPQTQKKRRWYQNFLDAIRLTVEAEPWAGWALAGIVLGSTAIGAGIGWPLGHPIYAGFLGLLASFAAAMAFLTWRVRKISYSRIENQPGASIAILDQIKRGWNIEREPVAINPRSQEMVFRMTGRPGIVLISEGAPGAAVRLLKDEERKAARVAPNVPIHLIQVGHGPGQVDLLHLEAKVRKLPKKLTAAEVDAVAKRLRSLGGVRAAIPKGIDPYRTRPSRKPSRG